MNGIPVIYWIALVLGFGVCGLILVSALYRERK